MIPTIADLLRSLGPEWTIGTDEHGWFVLTVSTPLVDGGFATEIMALEQDWEKFHILIAQQAGY